MPIVQARVVRALYCAALQWQVPRRWGKVETAVPLWTLPQRGKAGAVPCAGGLWGRLMDYQVAVVYRYHWRRLPLEQEATRARCTFTDSTWGLQRHPPVSHCCIASSRHHLRHFELSSGRQLRHARSDLV